MAIEIREIHFKTIIDGSGKNTDSHKRNSEKQKENEKIISACVEKVMEIIKLKEER